MTQISLVLPFGLPPPELAPDLIRALQTPALAALLARGASSRALPQASEARCLPHELWLAHALGLSASAQTAEARPAFAAAVMRAMGMAQAAGHWFLVHPVHIQIARNHLLLADPRRLALTEAGSRALFDAARPYFDDAGVPLLYGDADTWFLRADAWAGMDTASPDAAVGENLNEWLPSGAAAKACRKLQNEVQMLWYEHPVNEDRQARGQPPVNSFWPWADADAGRSASPRALTALDVPAWLSALSGGATISSASPANPSGATRSPPAAQTEAANAQSWLSALSARAAEATLVCDRLSGPAIATDWSAWLLEMQRLEQDWFAPMLAALRAGRIGQLRLVLSRRDALLKLTTTSLGQRKFWRRPSLNRLLP